MLFAALN